MLLYYGADIRPPSLLLHYGANGSRRLILVPLLARGTAVAAAAAIGLLTSAYPAHAEPPEWMIEF